MFRIQKTAYVWGSILSSTNRDARMKLTLCFDLFPIAFVIGSPVEFLFTREVQAVENHYPIRRKSADSASILN